MMRSVRDAPGSWIEVPSRSRVRWGEFDPDQPAPRYLRAAYDRVRATGRWYASASRAAMYTSRAVVGEGGGRDRHADARLDRAGAFKRR